MAEAEGAVVNFFEMETREESCALQNETPTTTMMNETRGDAEIAPVYELN